jgi:hypothetical protein
MPDLDDLEKWRAEAQHCTEMAGGAEPADAGRTWQMLAQAWLNMVAAFEDGDTRQEFTTSQH